MCLWTILICSFHIRDHDYGIQRIGGTGDNKSSGNVDFVDRLVLVWGYNRYVKQDVRLLVFLRKAFGTSHREAAEESSYLKKNREVY
jgi:hypothetical protein